MLYQLRKLQTYHASSALRYWCWYLPTDQQRLPSTKFQAFQRALREYRIIVNMDADDVIYLRAAYAAFIVKASDYIY